MCKSDIKVSENGMLVSIRHTKTNQYHNRVLSIPLVKGKSPLCPVSAVQNMFSLANNSPQGGPLFSYLDRSGRVRVLDHNLFGIMLHQCLEALGYDPKLYSGHSFRRGSASYSMSCGAPQLYIQAIGDWESSAWQCYIDFPMDYRQSMALLLTKNCEDWWHKKTTLIKCLCLGVLEPYYMLCM
jgi:hypothetical protein